MIVPSRAERPHVKDKMHDPEVQEDGRHEPPHLAVEDVVQAIVMPSAFLVAVLCRKVQRRLDPLTVSRRFLHEEDDDADGHEDHGQRSPAHARVSPKIGHFAIVFPKFLVALLLATADRRGGVDRFLKARVVGPAQVALQLFAGSCDVVFVIDPQQRALGPLVDAGFDSEGQKVIGEDLGVDPLRQCSDLAQRSIPSNLITAMRRAEATRPRFAAATIQTLSQITTRGPPAHVIALRPARGFAFPGPSPARRLASRDGHVTMNSASLQCQSKRHRHVEARVPSRNPHARPGPSPTSTAGSARFPLNASAKTRPRAAGPLTTSSG